MKRWLLLISALGFLAACVDRTVHPMATMYDPVTKTTKVCTVNSSEWGWDDGAIIARCMEDYERAGYVQVPDKK